MLLDPPARQVGGGRARRARRAPRVACVSDRALHAAAALFMSCGRREARENRVQRPSTLRALGLAGSRDVYTTCSRAAIGSQRCNGDVARAKLQNNFCVGLSRRLGSPLAAEEPTSRIDRHIFYLQGHTKRRFQVADMPIFLVFEQHLRCENTNVC